MKFIETEWALVNKKTGELYRISYGNKNIITFCSREDARDEKAGRSWARDYVIERVNVTYERIS